MDSKPSRPNQNIAKLMQMVVDEVADTVMDMEVEKVADMVVWM